MSVSLELVKLDQKHTCTNQDVQPHYEVSVKKSEQFTHQKLSSTALVKFTWSPGKLPSRTGAQTHCGRAHAAAPRSLLTEVGSFIVFFLFFNIFSIFGAWKCLAPLRLQRSYGAVSIVGVWRQATFTKFFFFFFNQGQFTGVCSHFYQATTPTSTQLQLYHNHYIINTYFYLYQILLLLMIGVILLCACRAYLQICRSF